MAYELAGTIKVIMDTQTFGSGFTKREFVVTDSSGRYPQEIKFELSFYWLTHSLIAIWQPFLLGCLLCGLFFGSVGYFVINTLWRLRVARMLRERKRRQRRAAELLADAEAARRDSSQGGISSDPG